MRRIDGSPRTDVHTHVGQHGLYARWRENDLRLPGSEADVAAAEGALLQTQHSCVEGARGLEVRRLVVGHDASNGHPQQCRSTQGLTASLIRAGFERLPAASAAVALSL